MNLEIKKGDVFWVTIPENLLGNHTQQGNRPCVIISNDIGNQHSPNVIIAMLSKKKKPLPTHLYVKSIKSIILCEQIFTIDKSLLGEYFGYSLKDNELENLDKCLKVSLGLNDNMQCDENVFGSLSVMRFNEILNEMQSLYERKNTDYGNSFSKTFNEEGLAMSRIRLSDKLERFKKLSKSSNQLVNDESIRDTLIDLANYAVMTIMELDGGTKNEPKN